jgi:hypothetical protein
MCDSVFFENREYRSPRQLAELVGGEDKLVWQTANPFRKWSEGKNWRDLDVCLCPINLEATLQQAGFGWRRGEPDPMEVFVERAEPR